MLDWEEIITWMDTATGPTALPSQTHYRSWNCIVSSGELGPNQERAGEIQWAGNQSGISGSNHASPRVTANIIISAWMSTCPPHCSRVDGMAKV